MTAIHSWRIALLTVMVALALALGACQNIPPYQPTKPGPTPTPAPASPRPQAPVEPAPTETPPAPAPEPPTPPPATRSYTLKPASRSLVTQAQTLLKSKDFGGAAANIERALRIEPQNPLLWIEYGKVRFIESNFAQAENMGRKALALASGDPRTQATAWRLIADSLQAQNKNTAAREASAKADSLLQR